MPASRQPQTRMLPQLISKGPWVPAMALAAVCLLAGARTIAAQDAPQATPRASAHKVLHHRVHPATPAAQKPAEPAAPPAPAAPPDPHWPANEKAGQASITWDAQGLRIEARNSSLQQILSEVATATGAKVEGMGTDERVFGQYGPGLARDVVSQLLHGSNYNVLMIGDQGQGAPRQIVLSARRGGVGPVAANQPSPANSDEDNDNDNDEQPPQPVPGRPPFAPGNGPRSPQQMMQEMQQQRQQQLQEQQQQQPMNQQPR